MVTIYCSSIVCLVDTVLILQDGLIKSAILDYIMFGRRESPIVILVYIFLVVRFRYFCKSNCGSIEWPRFPFFSCKEGRTSPGEDGTIHLSFDLHCDT